MATFIFMVVLYFLPTLLGRHKRSAFGIFLVNLLLGWTVIGWIVALVWACEAESRPATYFPMPAGRFCHQCGALGPASAHFCHACGQVVA